MKYDKFHAFECLNCSFVSNHYIFVFMLMDGMNPPQLLKWNSVGKRIAAHREDVDFYWLVKNIFCTFL